MSNKKDEKEKVYSVHRDNIINFPKPPPSSDDSRKKDVESRTRHTIHFEPDWDGWTDDSKDS